MALIKQSSLAGVVPAPPGSDGSSPGFVKALLDQLHPNLCLVLPPQPGQWGLPRPCCQILFTLHENQLENAGRGNVWEMGTSDGPAGPPEAHPCVLPAEGVTAHTWHIPPGVSPGLAGGG